MSEADYIIIFTAYAVAGLIKGLTGVGFSTSCLPIMALRLDLKIAIPLVIIPSIVSNISVMIQAGHFREAVRRFYPLYLASIPGLILGISVLALINVQIAKAALGIILISYAGYALTKHDSILSEKAEMLLKIPAGFCTGFVNGLTGSQVMPSLPFLLALDMDKKLFIQSINIYFTMASFVVLIGMKKLGFIQPHMIITAILGLIPVLGAVYIGGRIQQRMSVSAYKKTVLYFLLVMGTILILKLMT